MVNEVDSSRDALKVRLLDNFDKFVHRPLAVNVLDVALVLFDQAKNCRGSKWLFINLATINFFKMNCIARINTFHLGQQ